MSTPIVMSAQLNAAKSISNYEVQGEQLHEIGTLHKIGRAINDFFKGMTAGGKLEIANRNLQVASKLAELVVADTAMQMDAAELLMEPSAQNKALMSTVVKESFDALKLKAQSQDFHADFRVDFPKILDNIAEKMSALTDSQQADMITTLRQAFNIERHIDTFRLSSLECTILRGKLFTQFSDFSDRFDAAQTKLMEGRAAGGPSVGDFNDSIEKAMSSMKTGIHFIATLQGSLPATVTPQTNDMGLLRAVNNLADTLHSYSNLLDKIHDAPNLSVDKQNALNSFLKELHGELVHHDPTMVPTELRTIDTLMFPPTITEARVTTTRENLHRALATNPTGFRNPELIAEQFTKDIFRSGIERLGDNPLPKHGIDGVMKEGVTSPWYGHASEASGLYRANLPEGRSAKETIGLSIGHAEGDAQTHFLSSCMDEFLGVDFAYKDFISSIVQQGGIQAFCIIDMTQSLGLWSPQDVFAATAGSITTPQGLRTTEITRDGDNIQVKLTGVLTVGGEASAAANRIVAGIFDSPWEVTVNIPSRQNMHPTSTDRYVPEFTVDFAFTQSPALR